MAASTIVNPTENLAITGLSLKNKIHYQQRPGELVAASLSMGEGSLSDTGALVIHTGAFTGRSPRDKFTVKDDVSENSVHWNDFNIPIDPKYFYIIRKKITDYLNRLPEIWVRDCYACADPRFRLNIRVVN
ncbi:MAG: phosphoenolpyruvate carboxykinase (ATP), partial [Chitinophagaceae bacterium]|nr:phosphoenolpyruvate carboxykinase (ATP) [Chitinophagaceae bacterium]